MSRSAWLGDRMANAAVVALRVVGRVSENILIDVIAVVEKVFLSNRVERC